MTLFVLVSSALAASLTGKYVGFDKEKVDLPGGYDHFHAAMNFDPSTSTVRVTVFEFEALAPTTTPEACLAIPYTLATDGAITLTPSEACLKAALEGGSDLGLDLKAYLKAATITFDSAKDVVTMRFANVPGVISFPSKVEFVMPKAPKLAGAVFKGAHKEGKYDSLISATIEFNDDGTINFAVPEIGMDCKQEFYLADAEGAMFVPGMVYLPTPTSAERSRKEQINCVNNAFSNNDIMMFALNFDKTFETLTALVLYDDSGSSSSSSDSSSDSSQEEITFVLRRQNGPKSTFASWEEKALRFLSKSRLA